LTLQHADGNYPQTIQINGRMVGQCNPINIQGNIGTPANVTFPGTGSAVSFTGAFGAWFQLQGMTFSSSGSQALRTDGSGTIALLGTSATTPGSLIFGATGASAVAAAAGSNIRIVGSYLINGDEVVHFNMNAGGVISVEAASLQITVTGTRTFSNTFIIAQTGGIYFEDFTMTYFQSVGTSTGVRYSCQLNGVINTGGGGANHFPGNSAGSCATGGQYN
jgi:hypothetical protein